MQPWAGNSIDLLFRDCDSRPLLGIPTNTKGAMRQGGLLTADYVTRPQAAQLHESYCKQDKSSLRLRNVSVLDRRREARNY